MDNELLYQYLLCHTTEKEEQKILAWLEASPQNREQLIALCSQMETMALLSPRIEDLYTENNLKNNMRRRLRRWSAIAAAAVILLCAVTVYLTSSYYRSMFGNMEQTVVAQNAPLRFTLADGTTVWLNTGATLVTPAVFTGRERKVCISGEAMFDVTHNEHRPFVVQTAACDIRVLGTKFNVIADSSGKIFETALLKGQVEVMQRTTHERIILAANEKVTLRNGNFICNNISNIDDFLWTDGYINLKGHTFKELIERFQKVFDVKIDTGNTPLPKGYYQWGKIRISDGVDNAMKVLQDSYSFHYEFDPEHRTIIVEFH